MTDSRHDMELLLDSEVLLKTGGQDRHLSPTQAAYLMILALAGSRGERRKEVIRLLWEEPSTPRTRHRIRQLSYALNRKAGGSVVEANGPRLNLGSDVCIKWGTDRPWSAVEPPTGAYRDYLDDRRDIHRHELARNSVRVLDEARLADSPAAVLEILEAGRRPPGAWRELLWALIRTGRVREAEFEVKRLLGDDFPPKGLPALQRIAGETNRLLSLAAGGEASAVPLLGRSEDVGRLQNLIAGGHACILITGSHGVGRSRLLGQTLATVLSNQDDTVVRAVYGVPFERHRPFGGLGQLLSDDALVQAFMELDQPETEIIRRALPVQFDSPQKHELAQIGGPGSYLRVARAVGALFRHAYGQADVLMVVDDMHQLDRSSVEVITRMATLDGASLLATWCTDEEVAHSELLFRFRGLRPQVVPLSDLHLRESVQLCQAVAPELNTEEAEDIARLGGGRPGRIVELLRACRGTPSLAASAGPGLDGVLRERIRELTDVEQEVLTLVAVNGGRIEVELLAELLGHGVLWASGYVRSLEEAHIVRVEGDSVVVGPRMLTSFIMRELPTPMRLAIHSRLAAKMMTPGVWGDPALTAHHLSAAGRNSESRDWYLKAGLQAIQRYAYSEAITLLERSLHNRHHPDRVIALELGRLHSAVGSFDQALRWYERSRIGYERAGSASGALEAHLRRLGVQIEAGRDMDDHEEALRVALSESRKLQDRSLVALALDLALQAADRQLDSDWVRWARTELLAEIHTSDLHPLIALTGARLYYLGHPELGRKLARHAYLHLRNDSRYGGRALARLVICYCNPPGRITWRKRILIRHAELTAKTTADVQARFSLLANQAVWAMAVGDWEAASACIKAGAEVVGSERTDRASLLQINGAVLEVRRRDWSAAKAYLDRFALSMPNPHSTLNLLYHAARLLIAIEEGRLAEASRHFDRLESVDLSFPFASDVSLVAEALAAYRRRVGDLDGSDRLRREAARLSLLSPPDQTA